MNAEEAQIFAELSSQVIELRDMNVDLLIRIASVQAALNTLVSLHAQTNLTALDHYGSCFFSTRDAIAAALQNLGMQQALEDFLNRTQSAPSEPLAGPAIDREAA